MDPQTKSTLAATQEDTSAVLKMPAAASNPARDLVERFSADFKAIENEVGKVIVGMREELRLVVASVFTGGHVLMEGTPGLAKTLLVNSVAKTLGLDFQRIQFTPDLLPGDITGSLVQTQERKFEFKRGPVFANVILADEINRTGPKTQAALLESMQEKQVTVDETTYALPKPFMVLATQNPLESAGTYPLPDAQLDRFAIKINIKDPSLEELKQIFRLTTSSVNPEVTPIYSGQDAESQIIANQALVRSVSVSEEIEDLCAQVCIALNPNHPEGIKVESVRANVLEGPSPRGGQSAILLAKVYALLEGRGHVQREDLEKALTPALRHRITIRPEQMCEDNDTDQIIREVIEKVFE